MADGLKDRELQEYYESMGAMFSSPGWQHFTEDLKKIQEVANTLDDVKNEADLHFRRGQLDILKTVLAQPEVLEAAYEMLLKDEE